MKYIIDIILSFSFCYIISFPNIDIIGFEEIYNFIQNYALLNSSIQVINNIEFRKFIYIQNVSEIAQLELKMPIFNFTHCLNLLKEKNNIADINDIYIVLLEFNDQIYKTGKINYLSNAINTTFFKFFTKKFLMEGFLNYSICNNLMMNVQKRVQINKIN